MQIDWGREFLELLVDFGGGQGGHPGHVAVRFLLPSFFWTVLAFVAFREWRTGRRKKDRFIGFAAVIGVSRELIMFTAEYGSLRGFISFDALYPFYPPFEHATNIVSGIFIAAAFMNYLLQAAAFSRRYLIAASAVTLTLYAAASALWPPFLARNPGAAFGSFWADMAFRVSASVFLGLALAVFAAARFRGARVQIALLFGVLFLFLDEFLMIFNLATGERHADIYAPIRHNLHIWAIPLFLGVYWSDLKFSLQSALRDNTQERLRSEAIIAAMGDGISIQDTGFRILYQNRIHRDLIGDHAGELCYRAYERREQLCEGCPVAQSFQDGGVHRAERSVAFPEGTRSFEITASPLRDADGRIVAGIELVREVTERKRLYEEMAKTERLESLGLLAGGLAHDFNNLLTGIFGNIGLAKRFLEPDHRSYDRLLEAEKASLRASELTRQLLTFSKGGTPVKKTVLIADIIRESVNFTLSGSNVKPLFSIPQPVLPVNVDAGQMHQVFTNLALNAVQAMPRGGTLTVTVSNVNIPASSGLPLPAGGYVRISVADTGTGMDAEVLQKIFDPYFTTKQDGNGLGLATVYSIMKKHGGFVTAESKAGEGACFHLYLPAAASKAAEPGDVRQRVIEGRGRILVVDDEQIVRDTTGEMLRELGYQPFLASDGAEAVQAYRTAQKEGNAFDAVIMDLTVPGGMGGREAMQKLIQLDPAARVVVSSGYSADPVLSQYKQHGFKAAIPKPYSLETLGSVLAAVMNPGSRAD